MVGTETNLGQGTSYTKDLRLFLTAHVAELLYPAQEVAQGYKDVKERSAIVRFKVEGEDAYILAWTTTPWTLPSNVALCVNPDEDYVKVESSRRHMFIIWQKHCWIGLAN